LICFVLLLFCFALLCFALLSFSLMNSLQGSAEQPAYDAATREIAAAWGDVTSILMNPAQLGTVKTNLNGSSRARARREARRALSHHANGSGSVAVDMAGKS